MLKLHPVRAVAIAALAISAGFVTFAATSGTASAGKAPVSATCTGGFGSTTLTTVTTSPFGPINSLLTGCSSSSSKVTSYGVDVSFNNSSESGGTGTITWTSGKTTTFDYTNSAVMTNTCPTYLDQASIYEEAITDTNVGGTAKVDASGSGKVCVYDGSSDGTVYEMNLGSTTI